MTTTFIKTKRLDLAWEMRFEANEIAGGEPFERAEVAGLYPSGEGTAAGLEEAIDVDRVGNFIIMVESTIMILYLENVIDDDTANAHALAASSARAVIKAWEEGRERAVIKAWEEGRDLYSGLENDHRLVTGFRVAHSENAARRALRIWHNRTCYTLAEMDGSPYDCAKEWVGSSATEDTKIIVTEDTTWREVCRAATESDGRYSLVDEPFGYSRLTAMLTEEAEEALLDFTADADVNPLLAADIQTFFVDWEDNSGVCLRDYKQAIKELAGSDNLDA